MSKWYNIKMYEWWYRNIFFNSSINDDYSEFINDNDGGLRAYLISDKFRRIGDEFGNLIIQVLPPDNNSFFFR